MRNQKTIKNPMSITKKEIQERLKKTKSKNGEKIK